MRTMMMIMIKIEMMMIMMAKIKDGGVVVLKVVKIMILTHFVLFPARSRERRHAHLPEV